MQKQIIKKTSAISELNHSELPTLRNIKLIDLRDPERTMQLYERAVLSDQAEPGPRGRLDFFALVQHCLRIGNDPCALLSVNLYRERYYMICDQDESQAQRILVEYDRRSS